jgi:hypothetical protein
MTEQQQAIIALFNTKDAANMEIAQECAISTGLGRWFNRYINKLIAKISLILKRDNADAIIYTNDDESGINGDYKKRHKIAASALAFFVFDLRQVSNISDTFKWCEYVIFDIKGGEFLQVVFDCDWHNTIIELKSLGCRFNEI